MKEIKLSKNVIVKVELEVPAFEGTNITLSYPRISIDFAEAVFIKVFRTTTSRSSAFGGDKLL